MSLDYPIGGAHWAFVNAHIPLSRSLQRFFPGLTMSLWVMALAFTHHSEKKMTYTVISLFNVVNT